jgi:hypothetical protein
VTAREAQLAESRVERELDRCGLLPFTDSEVPSLVSIVAGAPVTGSWWGHPAGQLIYEVGQAIEDDPDVLVVRLWGGKLTLVHRRLWPTLVRIGRAKAPWQTSGLSDVGIQVLVLIERGKRVRGDDAPPNFPGGSRDFSGALRDLDRRMLILTRSVHTSTGAHALEAESWAALAARTRTPRYSGTVRSAQRTLEEAAQCLAPRLDPAHVLPWGRNVSRAAALRH